MELKDRFARYKKVNTYSSKESMAVKKSDSEESNGTLDWQSAVERFLDHCGEEGFADRTLELHATHLRVLYGNLAFIGRGHLLPTEVSKKDLREVLKSCQKRNLSPRSINLYRQTWKKFFAYLVKTGYRQDNPMEDFPKMREVKKRPKALTDAEVKALLSQPDIKTFTGLRDYVMMLVLLDTGMRVSELCDVREGDLDDRERTIRLLRTKDHEERHVFLSPATMEWLNRYRRMRGMPPATNHVFVTARGKPMKRSTVFRQLEHYGKKAGITHSVSPHVLRHTFARMYIMAGGDPFSLKAILGHSTMEMVNVYVDLWALDMKRLHDRYTPLNQIIPDMARERQPVHMVRRWNTLGRLQRN